MRLPPAAAESPSSSRWGDPVRRQQGRGSSSSFHAAFGSTTDWASPRAQLQLMQGLGLKGDLGHLPEVPEASIPSPPAGTSAGASHDLDAAADALGWPGLPPDDNKSRESPTEPPPDIAARDQQRALWRWRSETARETSARWLWLSSCMYRLRVNTLHERKFDEEKALWRERHDLHGSAMPTSQQGLQYRAIAGLKRWRSRAAELAEAERAWLLVRTGSEHRVTHAALGAVAKAAEDADQKKRLDACGGGDAGDGFKTAP